MRNKTALMLILLSLFSIGYAQNQNNDDANGLQNRIRDLESAVASLDTRLQTHATTGAGSLGSSVTALSAQSRIDDLERQVESLSRQVASLQRQAEQASRDAANAVREAAAARRDARDAMMRAR